MRVRNKIAIALVAVATWIVGLVGPGTHAVATSGPADAIGPAGISGIPTRWPAPAAEGQLPRDALTRALHSGVISESRYALLRAISAFDVASVRRDYGRVARPHPHDTTGLLLDLALQKESLSPRDKVLARALLARPTDAAATPAYSGYSNAAASHYQCSTNLCVHWETETRNEPPPGDGNGNGVPDQVDKTLATFNSVWEREVTEMGYRPPRPDFKPPNQRLDIFLVDLGADGTYGYCAIEDPAATEVRPRHASAFCAVDNDYSTTQYPTGTPTDNLQVTAAHEFFHAIQFGYDFTEDRWFMESTATWIEDEIYDGVNDNYQYLAASALAHPNVSLDYVGVVGEPSGLYRYGSWIFFRFLAEWVGSGNDASVVRSAWERADSAAGAPDDYSLKAVQNAVQARGRSFARAFADFGAMNYLADGFYEEGPAYLRELGSRPPHQAAFILSEGEPSTGARSVSLDHLATRYIWIEHGPDLREGTTLEIRVDGPAGEATPMASAITMDGESGRVYPITLDGDGVGRTVVPFASVRRVMLVLSNASTRYSCNHGTEWSCRGRATDDDQNFSYTASLARESSSQPGPGPATTSAPSPSASPAPSPSSSSGGNDGKAGLLTGVSDAPDPFTPNGDGVDDRTEIVFTVTRDASVTIKVFNRAGDLVRVIGKNLPTPAGYYFVTWNGRREAGGRVRSGTYTYVVKAQDSAGLRDRVKSTTTVRR